MGILFLIWVVLRAIIGFNLVFPLLLSGIYTIITSLRTSQIVNTTPGEDADYAVIVTAYEQTHMLKGTVDSLLKMNYQNYVIYIVADNCDISGLHFESDKVILLRPEEVIRNNIGSHLYAISNFIRKHERLTIIDSDNLVHSEYLNRLNKYFNAGYSAVQGIRAAKNLDTMLACLDAARDKYYHYYDGKMLFGSGSSATLAGSGMAFTTELYLDCLQDTHVEGAGFDKVLQYKIVNSGKRVAFADDVYVYDEKTSTSDQLVKQRARWINTWFKYFYYGLKLTCKGILTANWNRLLFGVVLLRPPLFIFLILSVIMMIANLFITPLIGLAWLGGLMLFVLSFFIALSNMRTDKRIYRSLTHVPKFIFFQVLSLIKSRNASKHSVATKHHIN